MSTVYAHILGIFIVTKQLYSDVVHLSEWPPDLVLFSQLFLTLKINIQVVKFKEKVLYLRKLFLIFLKINLFVLLSFWYLHVNTICGDLEPPG